MARCAMIATLSLTVLLPATVMAAVYSFVDEDGVIHFTNVPDDPRYRPHRLDATENTYELEDERGKRRRSHLVDVRRYDPLIIEAASYYSLPPALVKAVIAAESGFEPAAVSHAGAQGLMQLIPSTARAMHVRDVFNPRDNIYGGARYLRLMANRFQGDLRLTLAAYNAGPEAVERKGTIPPFEETRKYVRRVLRLYQHYLATWRESKQP